MFSFYNKLNGRDFNMDSLEKKKINLEKKISREKEKKTIFSELSRIFKTVVKILGDEKGLEAVKQPHHETYVDRHALITEAKKISQELESFKDELIQEFGQASYVFITKSIDPIIHKAISIIDEMKQQEEGNLFEKAVHSAQLYVQFSDEKKLKKRIIADGIVAMREAIQKDSAVLEHYAHHALIDAGLDTEQYRASFQAKLQPVLDKLYALEVQTVPTENLREFFIWKSNIDDKRSILAEEGFMIIDTLIAQDKKEKDFQGAESFSDEPSEADWAS